MSSLEHITAILPSLNPDERLVKVASGLREAGFTDIVVVDDGSDSEHKEPFRRVEADGCTVLVHEKNRGKGAALRTAMEWCLAHCPDLIGIVTADGDGQHIASDVVRCAETMREDVAAGEETLVLGVRDFSLPDIPPRSVFGNRLTSRLFKLFFHMKISDTQTGLRAMPASQIPLLLSITGDRYEYETNMLLEWNAHHLDFHEVPIETIYEDNNSVSHFNPLRDSVRIYGLILKFAASSLVSYLVDQAAFSLFYHFLKKVWTNSSTLILFSTVLARVISSLINFWCNKHVVFGQNGDTAHTLLRYYALAIPQMLISAGIVAFFSKLLGEGTLIVVIIKMITDTLLFFLSFRIQREWVFRKPKQ